jgi:hypothetical protein
MGDYDKAQYYMNMYETKSGRFDSHGNIEAGREIYYKTKGLFFLHTNNLDSAEYYFRKEMHDGKDYGNQNSAANGLALLYQKLQRPDSTAKYAIYAYAMLDSVYAQKATKEVERMQAMYDYTRSEQKSHQKEREADRFRLSLVIISALSAILILLFVIVFIRNQNEKRRLAERIQILSGYAINRKLHDSSIAQHFRHLLNASPNRYPDLKDWKELTALFENEMPNFRLSLSKEEYTPSDFEYEICMLIKIQISSSDIARLKQCSPAYITQIRKAIYKNLISKNGRANELDEYILQLL